LLLDAYMQCFHIGSYRLATHFSQRGGLVPTAGKHLLVAMFRISNPWFMCRVAVRDHGISVCDSLYGGCFGPYADIHQ